MEGVTGKINYPKLRKTLDVFLEPGDDEKIIAIMQEIQNTVNSEFPPVANRMKLCKNCSYGDMCWI